MIAIFYDSMKEARDYFNRIEVSTGNTSVSYHSWELIRRNDLSTNLFKPWSADLRNPVQGLNPDMRYKLVSILDPGPDDDFLNETKDYKTNLTLNEARMLLENLGYGSEFCGGLILKASFDSVTVKRDDDLFPYTYIIELQRSSHLEKSSLPIGEVKDYNINQNPLEKPGIDPKTMLEGISLGSSIIASGTRTFSMFVRAMVRDLGPGIKPYLKMLYNAVRDHPDSDHTGMDYYNYVSTADIDEILVQRVTNNGESLMDIARRKLDSLNHYPTFIQSGKSVIAQLMNHLIFSQETSGNGTDLELLVLKLTSHSDKVVHNYLFSNDPYGENEMFALKLLDEAVSEEDIYHVMIVELLQSALMEREEPEPQ